MSVTEKKKELHDARERFISKMTGIRSSLFVLVRDMKRRRRRKQLKDAWVRFKAKMAGIRSRTLALMTVIENEKSEKRIEEARRNIEKT